MRKKGSAEWQKVAQRHCRQPRAKWWKCTFVWTADRDLAWLEEPVPAGERRRRPCGTAMLLVKMCSDSLL